MKNILLKGLLIGGIAVAVLAALYYKESNKDLPLSEIFPEEHPYQADIEYVNETTEQPTQPVQNKIPEVKTRTIAKPIPMPKPVKESIQTAATSNSINQKAVLATPQYGQKFYTVQVASLKDKSKAEALIQNLKKKSFDSFLKAAEVKDKGIVYRIYAGNFVTKAKAEDFLQSNQKDLNGGFVVVIQ